MGAKNAEKEAAKTAQARELYEKYKGNGNADIKAKKYESSVRWYTEALKYAASAAMGPGPQNPTAVILSNRSLALLKLDRLPQALQDATACVKSAPNWTKSYFRVGEAFRHMGKYVEAEEAFTQAAALDPNDPALAQYLKKTADKAELQRTPEAIHPLEIKLGLNCQTIWPARGGAAGFLFGLIVVLLDAAQARPSLSNIALQLISVLGAALLGAGVGFAVFVAKGMKREEELRPPGQPVEPRRNLRREHVSAQAQAESDEEESDKKGGVQRRGKVRGKVFRKGRM